MYAREFVPGQGLWGDAPKNEDAPALPPGVAGCVEIKILRRVRASRVHLTHWFISTQVAGKKLYHPVKCAADAKLGALARGMAQGHNSMETMSAPRQDMLVGALEGFLEDLGQ